MTTRGQNDGDGEQSLIGTKKAAKIIQNILNVLLILSSSPSSPYFYAEIVLLTADGLGTVEIMRRTGKSKTCVWRWQERFAAEGVDGLLRDKTRPLARPAARARRSPSRWWR